MATRNNPKLFGQDLVGAGVKALGAVASAAVNDKFLWPTLRNMIPGAGVPSQLAHAGATLVAAAVIGKGADMVGQRKLGDDLQQGGTIMGIADGVGAFVPGFSLTGKFPTSLQLPKTAAAPAALNPGNTNTGLPSGAGAVPTPVAPNVTGQTFSGI